MWQIYSSVCSRLLGNNNETYCHGQRGHTIFSLLTKDEVSYYLSNKRQCITLDKDDGNKIYDRKPTTLHEKI